MTRKVPDNGGETNHGILMINYFSLFGDRTHGRVIMIWTVLLDTLFVRRVHN